MLKIFLYANVHIWSQLGSNPKLSDLNNIQTAQNTIVCSITSALPYISNPHFHYDKKIKTIHKEAKTYYL